MSLTEPKKQDLALYSPEQVALIKSQIAKDATDDELKLFMLLSKTYDLDPFKKEIWFIKYGKTAVPQIYTSRDGYLKIAQNNPAYDGVISFPVCEGDVFEIDAANYTVIHKFGAKRGKILGAWARCDIKGRRPTLGFVPFSEYIRDTPSWRSNPSAMIQKVAESFVLRRACGISGLRTVEEIGIEEIPVIEKPAVKKTTKKAVEYPIIPCPACKVIAYAQVPNGDMHCTVCGYHVKADDEELKPK